MSIYSNLYCNDIYILYVERLDRERERKKKAERGLQE